MRDRLVVVSRGFVYPIGASLARVREAGGLSQLSPAERARIVWKSVAVGDDCSDMPSESVARYLERGDIAIVAQKSEG